MNKNPRVIQVGRSTVAAVALLVALAAWMLASEATAAEDPQAAVLERRVKAAFLSKFPGYVEWPDGALPAASPLVIAVAGDDAIVGEIERALADRAPGERPIVVRRISAAPAQGPVHVLFLGRHTDPARTAQLLEGARGRPVLTVTEADGPQHPASVIHFVVVDSRVRFDVSRAAAERNGLKLAAPLLSVARRVGAAS